MAATRAVSRAAWLLAALATACTATPGWAKPAPAAVSASSPASAVAAARPQLANYAGKVRAAILPYILEPEVLDGNPSAEVKVTTKPNGDVVDAELTRSSGQPAWDVAVRRAVLKAGRIPLDTDGKVPPVLYLVFRPR